MSLIDGHPANSFWSAYTASLVFPLPFSPRYSKKTNMTHASAPHDRTGLARARLVRLFLILVALLGLVTCGPTRDLAKGLPEEATRLALRASEFEAHDSRDAAEWSVSVDVSEGRGTFLETLLLEGDREVGLTNGTTRRVRELAPADAMRLEHGFVGLVTETHPLSPKTGATASPALETRRVVATIFHLAEVLVTIRTARGEVVATTDHPFLKSGVGWIKAGELVVGDEIVTAQSGAPVRVVSTEISRVPPTPVYNLTIEGTHTYYVGPEALLVHNTCGISAGAAPTGPFAGKTDGQIGADYDKALEKSKKSQNRIDTANVKLADTDATIAALGPPRDPATLSSKDKKALQKAQNNKAKHDQEVVDANQAKVDADKALADLSTELNNRKKSNDNAVQGALNGKTFTSANSTVTAPDKNGVMHTVDVSADLNKIQSGSGGNGNTNDGIEFGDKGGQLAALGGTGPFVEYNVKDQTGSYNAPDGKINAARVVVDTSTGKAYLTLDHYGNFVEIP